MSSVYNPILFLYSIALISPCLPISFRDVALRQPCNLCELCVFVCEKHCILLGGCYSSRLVGVSREQMKTIYRNYVGLISDDIGII